MASKGLRLVAGGGLDGVAMHGVAGPHDDPALALHGADQFRQMLFNLVGAEARDERQAARLIFRIQNVDELDEFIGLQRWARISGRSDS